MVLGSSLQKTRDSFPLPTQVTKLIYLPIIKTKRWADPGICGATGRLQIQRSTPWMNLRCWQQWVCRGTARTRLPTSHTARLSSRRPYSKRNRHKIRILCDSLAPATALYGEKVTEAEGRWCNSLPPNVWTFLEWKLFIKSKEALSLLDETRNYSIYMIPWLRQGERHKTFFF